jgi:hypothetical protein
LNCEFCATSFTPRTQTKSPRACGKNECQKKRQKLNEHEWRQKNKGLYDKKYHQVKKIVRDQRLKKIVASAVEALSIGCTLKDFTFNAALWATEFTKFLASIGIRLANKLWTSS